MDNTNIKETKMIIRTRNYNGDYGIGSVFVNETEFIVQQLLENPNKEDGLIRYSENIGFCADEKLGSKPLATIKAEIPFLVTYDKLNIFNEIINKIKANPEYKYNETHYVKDRFDPKRLEYVDVIIDGEEFEIYREDGVYSKIYSEVLDGRNSGIPKMFDEFYQKLSDLMRKTNKIEYDDPSILNIPYEERIVTKLVDKVKDLAPNVETTIAQLLQLTNEDVASIEPLIQGTVFNNLIKVCEESNIGIEVNHDEFGGLGYHYKFKKINSTNNENIINELVDAIEKLPKGTEIALSSIMGDKFKNYSTNELFEINKKVLSVCKERGIILNFDKYKDQAVGLPFNIPFIKE